MRETFSLSRSMEYFTRDELVRQCGHSQSPWPILLLKELLDNALDACESALIQPKITVSVDSSGSSSSITVLGYPLKCQAVLPTIFDHLQLALIHPSPYRDHDNPERIKARHLAIIHAMLVWPPKLWCVSRSSFRNPTGSALAAALGAMRFNEQLLDLLCRSGW
jgi:hypothetical protein